MTQPVIQTAPPGATSIKPAPPANPAAQPKRTSLDRAQLASWRFSETNGFVIKDYTGIDAASGQEPMIFVIKSSEIFEVMADAAAEQKKITVFAVGPCVLDLS